MFHQAKKISLVLAASIFIFINLFGVLFSPEPARAQAAVAVLSDAQATAKQIIDQIYDGLKSALLNATVKIVSYAMKKIAYDSAVWLASGGKGQSPFAHTKDFGSYLESVGDEAVGAGIEELGKPFTLNLCKIPDAKVDLAFKIGIRFDLLGAGAGNPPKPRCTLSEFKKNWADGWNSQYGSGNITDRFNASLATDDSDLGIALDATAKINELAFTKREGATLQRVEGQGFIPKTDKIGNAIRTPAADIMHEMQAILPSSNQQSDEQQLAALLTNGDIKVIPSILGIFLQNLVGTMAKNFQDKGMLPFGLCVGDYGGESCKQSGDVASRYEGSGLQGGRRAAEDLFSDFLTPVKIAPADNYDIVSRLADCPDSPDAYNCRADGDLIRAAQQIDSGSPLTIGEAMAKNKNLLHGAWKLIPPQRTAENTDKNCYRDKYCYANIKVLRQARLLPLGFEIAALNSDPDRPWTLAEVVNGFNDCAQDKTGRVIYDSSKPFCHLIDPNWVLKIPQTRCNAYVNGSLPLSGDVAIRLQECADLASCVSYDKNGACQNYSYCTRERNTWKFSGEPCDSQFATCHSFKNASGETAAYLYRTLDTGFCTQNSVGCAAYSLTQDNRGRWIAPAADSSLPSYNTGIHFNSQLASNCSANSAGCSAFGLVGSEDKTPVYLRRAPDYLRCYDSNPATPEVDWPKTPADLQRIQPRAECKDYAGACISEEASCNWYTPQGGDAASRVPGRFTPADQCDAKCVGYAAYRELPDTYSVGQDVTYIIPASGAKCKVEEAGCSSFTNLGTVSGADGEQVEHYTYLRSCVTEKQNAGKNFITYEGSATGGFQLKTYRLVENLDPQNGPVGAPKYFYTTLSDLKTYSSLCNESAYKAHKVHEDCRQFNDDQGKVYYRLLAKTIPVDELCSAYRLNARELFATDFTDDNGALLPPKEQEEKCGEQDGFWNKDGKSGQGQCEVCPQNGKFQNGACYYYGLPDGVENTAGISKVCSAEADTCRAFKGNAGNNIKIVVNDNFEGSTSTALKNWSGNRIELSLESTHTSEHSLSSAGATVVQRAVTATAGKSYDLTFWAKGGVQKITASLAYTDENNKMITQEFGSAGVGDVWRYYRLGPVEFSGASSSARLVFAPGQSGALFLDNVKMIESIDNLYLVKKSLSVDPLCDRNPDDNLPGEALGCSAYQDEAKNTYYLTNFSYLCREDAINCTALFDKQNTPDETGPRAHNLWLFGESGQKAIATVGKEKFSCQIPTGENGCFVKTISGYSTTTLIESLGSAAFVTSTVYIPADSKPEEGMYLVAKKEFKCNAVDLGCTFSGLMQNTAAGVTFATKTIKNDPAQYDKALCQSEAVGCDAYSDGSGTRYFKNPTDGEKVCVYRPKVMVKGIVTSGWFRKGGGDQPCYPDYLENGSSYGLWSYGNTSTYRNFVGECLAEHDKCTEIVDHNDSDRPWYRIKDDKLAAGDCNGEVSQKEGCALFDQTDNPAKFWSTADTYRQSEGLDGKRVAPAPAKDANFNDANLILKVTRDRECGEWLQCRSSHRVWDGKNSRWKNVCDDIGRCARAQDAGDASGAGSCSEWVDGISKYSNQPLTQKIYVERAANWTEMDFDGYTFLGQYPAEELSQVNLAKPANPPDWRLARRVPCGGGENCVNKKYRIDDFACINSPCGDGGACFNGVCVKNIDETAKSVTASAPALRCRAYPEPDAPFPNFLLSQPTPGGITQPYHNVNYCNETPIDPKNPNAKVVLTSDLKIANKCDCAYTKVTYGEAIPKYWAYADPNKDGLVKYGGDQKNKPPVPKPPGGICLGGDQNGKACDSNDDCFRGNVPTKESGFVITDGICQSKKSEEKLVGWSGYCLEEDSSRILNGDPSQHPCLSWLPIENLAGSLDINSLNPDAGYQGGPGYKCLAANVFKQPIAVHVCTGDTGGLSCDNNGCQDNINASPCPINYTKISGACADKMVIQSDRTYSSPGGNYLCHIDDPKQNCISYCVPNSSHTISNGKPLSCDNQNDPESLISKRRALGPLKNDDNDEGKKYKEALKDLLEKAKYCAADYLVPAIKSVENDQGFFGTIYEFNGKQFNGTSFIQDPGNYYIGCQQLADVSKSDKLVAWTDRTWKDGAQYRLNPAKADIPPEFSDRLNYFGLSSLEPFANTLSPSPLTKVLFSPWCSNVDAEKSTSNSIDVELRMPKTEPDLACSDPQNNLLVKDANGKPINESRSYSPYDFTVQPEFNKFEDLSSRFLKNEIVIANFADYWSKALIYGKKLVQQLFARVEGGYNYVFSDYDQNGAPLRAPRVAEYQPTDSKQDWNITRDGEGKPPVILSLGNCQADGKCLEGKPGVTINGQTSGTVVSASSYYNTTMSFFAFADGDHMPIYRLRVNWGDTKESSITGSISNRRGLLQSECNIDSVCADPVTKQALVGAAITCTKDTAAAVCPQIAVCQENPSNFGFLLNKSCDNAYFQFNHPYQCYVNSPGYLPAGDQSCPAAFNKGCCVFRPKVQVEDNWGWCNGNCFGRLSGCFDKSKNDPTAIQPADNDCQNSPEAWLNSGVSIVMPAK